MTRVPWLCFQVLVRRLGPLNSREFVLGHVHAILIHELVRSKVGWKMFRVHAFDGFIGKTPRRMFACLPYGHDKILRRGIR